MKVYLPVHVKTGEVDYEWLSSILTEVPTAPRYELIEGWEWKLFSVIPNEALKPIDINDIPDVKIQPFK